MIAGLVVKVAFIVVLDRFAPLPGDAPHIQPTLRVSQQLYPKVSKPKVTVALSQVNNARDIKPLYIARIY